MGPGEIAGLASGGYISIGLCAARYMYHHYNFEFDFDRAPASALQIVIWPFTALILGLMRVITAPTRRERKAVRLKEAERERERRAAHIRQMERDLGIGQPDPMPVLPPPPKPTLGGLVQAVIMGIPPKRPDNRCAFCIPGRGPSTPNYCPFYPGCQS